jgi:hypothetical protein
MRVCERGGSGRSVAQTQTCCQVGEKSMAHRVRQFDDETIQRLFGHEAAENEDATRLRQYYFKSQIYDRITSKLPLRILVGHKGIGKSALFTVAMQEDHEAGVLALLIRPDDVLELSLDEKNFLRRIRQWKDGLLRIIFGKALSAVGVQKIPALTKGARLVGRMTNFVADILKPAFDKAIDVGKVKDAALGKFLANSEVNVYLDDLDRGWTGDREGIERMSTLLNALRDLSTDYHGLRFRVAMRSDVYFLVRTADESTDKIEGSVVWHTWTNHEILAMLIKRIQSYFDNEVDEHTLMGMKQRDLALPLEYVMEPVFRGRGHWERVPTYKMLMSLVRKRPRDLVKLCTLAAQNAYNNQNISIATEDFNAIFEPYSQGRLQDTSNEFRSELPDVERLLLGMRPTVQEVRDGLGNVYSTDALIKKIKNIEEQGQFKFFNGRTASPKALAHFMYKINFLTARKDAESGQIVRKYFEENKYLASEFAEFGFHWEIHPAYRWALQPDDPRRIFDAIALAIDE